MPATSQRLYELLSYRIFAALKHGHRRASMLYSDYCASAPLPRQITRAAILKQMYQIHRPHLNSGYIQKVDYERAQSQAGVIDLMIYYTPGWRAIDEYKAFNSPKKISEGRVVNWETDYRDDLSSVLSSPPNAGLPKPLSDSEQLVNHFLLKRFGHARRKIASKEIKLAADLIGAHGLETAKELVAEAVQQALNGNFKVIWFGGLASYLYDISNKIKQKEGEKRKNEEAKRRAQLLAQATAIYETLSETEKISREERLVPRLVTEGWEDLLQNVDMKAAILKQAVIEEICLALAASSANG
jgi:hypothetical protein